MPRTRRRDLGRLFARVLCVALASVGAIPLLLGVLVRTRPVRDWAAHETSTLLVREFGVVARYEVDVEAWPMRIALHDLVVDATDGGDPFLRVDRVTVRPRIFSLLAGQLEIGDVDIDGPELRLVIEQGALRNLAYRLPSSGGSGEPWRRSPFASLAVTDASVRASVEGTRLEARELDVDVTAETGLAFEVSARGGTTRVARARPVPGAPGEIAFDEDVLCRLEAAGRVDPRGFLVRRLRVDGALDLDPEPDTSPGCALPADDWRHAHLRLGGVRGTFPGPDGEMGPLVAHVTFRLPTALAHRFVDVPAATGWLGARLYLTFDPGERLPTATGEIEGEDLGLNGYYFARTLAAELSARDDRIALTRVRVGWGDGEVSIESAVLRPQVAGLPLAAEGITLRGVEFPGMMRDLDVHPSTWVAWTLRDGGLARFGGTLDPLELEGRIEVETRDFAVYDRPARSPDRFRMVSVDEARVEGSFRVRPAALVLSDMLVTTPRSQLRTTISLGYDNQIALDVYPGARVDLSEVSPLATVSLAGVASVSASMRGDMGDPVLTGELSVAGLSIAGHPTGDLESARVTFRPLVLELADARMRKNKSTYRAPLARLDFGGPATVRIDAEVDASSLELRDFFHVFHFDQDPRFDPISGVFQGRATVLYELDGPLDVCGGGYLAARGRGELTRLELFEERYRSATLDFDAVWDDRAAQDLGLSVDIPSVVLRKGSGTILGGGSLRPGGVVRGHAVASNVPISALDTLGPVGKLVDGTLSGTAEVSGTIDQLATEVDVHVSRVRVGGSTYPPGRLSVSLSPNGDPPRPLGETRCGRPLTPPFDRTAWERDPVLGTYRIAGALFGGQVDLHGVELTRQRKKTLRGPVVLRALDLGTLANLLPGVAFAEGPAPRGALSATMDFRSLPLDALERTEATLEVSALEVQRGGQRVVLARPTGPIAVARDQLDLPELALTLTTANGLSATLQTTGSVRHVMTAPMLDVEMRLLPTDLSRIGTDLPGLERASGTVDARLSVDGPATSPRFSGHARLRGGELGMRGMPVVLGELEVDIEIGGGEVRVARARGTAGGGTLSFEGRAPLRGFDLGTATGHLVARGVRLPLAEGIALTADGDLTVSYRPPKGDEDATLPLVSGDVTLHALSYTRPIAMAAEIGDLARRTARSEVKVHDPENDFVRFQLQIHASRSLAIKNDLLDLQLAVERPGLTLTGTNQRFGLRGQLRALPEGKLKLRANEFDVKEGHVRFDDPTRLAPKVDVTAVTDYRRYAGVGGADGASAGGAGGRWRIVLHAHGDAERLELNMTSEPALSQEDIVLLLTVGMTRAEIDQAQAAALGETAALEALSALTGADKAVRTALPIIDDFRFGSAYSSRSGRTEPTVTVGKRLTEQVRASVTTGLTENSEVRSNVEWKLGRRLSVQGSYDNVNDVSSSSIGNIGADLRWRLEFE